MAHIDFIERVHTSTKRNYLERVVEHDKAECATVAKQFGKDYWDGDRRYGYGGYYYDGRWRSVAENMVNHYGLNADAKILDVGCGKGFLLYEFTQLLPQNQVAGIDVSQYAIDNCEEEVRPFLQVGNALDLPFEDNSFDLVVSINTLHNLYNFDLKKALQEIERVGKQHKYLVVDSYRTEQEKVNLLYWQITCECFYTPQEWEWFFTESGYTGDSSYVFYE
jgi:protein-L-isoaspartate(D-aspartate) O-methyltransferase